MSKPAELREQTDEQLDLLLREVQHNLFRLRLQSETERLEAPSEIVKAKREVARIKTILRQREIEREASVLAPAPEREPSETRGKDGSLRQRLHRDHTIRSDPTEEFDGNVP